MLQFNKLYGICTYYVRFRLLLFTVKISKIERNNKLGVIILMRSFSWLLIIGGLSFLIYGGYQLLDSYLKENQRVDEAKAFVSEEIVDEIDDDLLKFYESIEIGETIGILYIPKLDRELPIVEGTDEDELAQGVGHYRDSGLPGENRQILLSGHRDTVFRQFGELEHGDEFHIQMEHGTFVYVIHDHEIVPADDRTVIDPTREEEYLTVSTCYPFNFVGSAPDRYVLYAYPK